MKSEAEFKLEFRHWKGKKTKRRYIRGSKAKDAASGLASERCYIRGSKEKDAASGVQRKKTLHWEIEGKNVTFGVPRRKMLHPGRETLKGKRRYIQGEKGEKAKKAKKLYIQSSKAKNVISEA